MARKKSKNKATSRADKAKSTKKREPPARMIVRPTAAPARKPEPAPAPPRAQPSRQTDNTDDNARTPLAERVAGMGTSHVATAAGAGFVSTAASVFAVGKGWVSPKLASGLVAGTGAATTAAGYHWEWDHVMAAGVGMTASGGIMLSGQYAVDWYQAMEKRAAEKRAKKEAEKEGREGKEGKDAQERDKPASKRRNARRIIIKSQEPDEKANEYDDYPAYA